MVHRALFGSFERFIGILTEHFAGAFPVWIMPEQVRVMTISEKFSDYAKEINDKLLDAGIKSELDNRSETIGKKIREAQLQKIPYMLIIGENEMENNTVAVRRRGKGDIGSMTLEQLIAAVKKDIDEKTVD